jgi:hypothetical protein
LGFPELTNEGPANSMLEPCLNETLLFNVDPNDLLLMKEIIIYNLREFILGKTMINSLKAPVVLFVFLFFLQIKLSTDLKSKLQVSGCS